MPDLDLLTKSAHYAEQLAAAAEESAAGAAEHAATLRAAADLADAQLPELRKAAKEQRAAADRASRDLSAALLASQPVPGADSLATAGTAVGIADQKG